MLVKKFFSQNFLAILGHSKSPHSRFGCQEFSDSVITRKDQLFSLPESLFIIDKEYSFRRQFIEANPAYLACYEFTELLRRIEKILHIGKFLYIGLGDASVLHDSSHARYPAFKLDSLY